MRSSRSASAIAGVPSGSSARTASTTAPSLIRGQRGSSRRSTGRRRRRGDRTSAPVAPARPRRRPPIRPWRRRSRRSVPGRRPGQHRDLLARHALGLAAAVPVLVQGAHRRGGLGWTPQHRHHPGPAVAPGLDHRLALGGEAADGAQELPGPGERGPVGGGRVDHEAQDLAPVGPVHPLEVPLQRQVVGREQLGHARRRARAAGVLEEERVEQGHPGLGVDPEPARHLEADRRSCAARGPRAAPP